MADLVCGVSTGSEVLSAINDNTDNTGLNATNIAQNVTDIAATVAETTTNTSNVASNTSQIADNTPVSYTHLTLPTICSV